MKKINKKFYLIESWHRLLVSNLLKVTALMQNQYTLCKPDSKVKCCQDTN